jgi:hypothetical protein
MYLMLLLFVHLYLMNQQLMNLLFYQHKSHFFLSSQFEYLMEYIVKIISLNLEPGNRNSTIVFGYYNYKSNRNKSI